ncbi:mitochondrion organization and biogenesis protein [Trichophyton equinum CBS 127.97]|uniref:Required for respiratory growth protein 9, mitochondrial n=1 Tax=Trichophyton equinum (strain ATCC MYA-4606 / CBS 127.97) TaxID=559882 RepID=F2PLV0_TRIEC|nr:mitochondrion organization and biogenesis protein [Trichophyton equinum CBS 127.97]
MSSQPLTAANIFSVLRHLRSLCYPTRSVTTASFTPSITPQIIPSRAYNNYTATHYTPLSISKNGALKQWHFAASYSTAPPAKAEKETAEDTSLSKSTKPKPKKPLPAWAVQKNALKEKFKEGWKPRKKVSPDTMESIRKLHSMDSVKFSTKNLAEEFKISPEAIRRILKSKWRATETEEIDRRNRWEKRKIRIQEQMMELGLRHTDPTSKGDPSTEEVLSQRHDSLNAIKDLSGGYLSQSKHPEGIPQKKIVPEDNSSRNFDPWEVTADDLLGTKRNSARNNWLKEDSSKVRSSSSQRHPRRIEYNERSYKEKPGW